jgi:hypothetical protein
MREMIKQQRNAQNGMRRSGGTGGGLVHLFLKTGEKNIHLARTGLLISAEPTHTGYPDGKATPTLLKRSAKRV